MEILDHCRTLYNTLETVHRDLLYVEKELKNRELPIDEYERLYKKEFELAMDISGIYEDLCMNLEELSKQHGLSFLANRMRRNAEEMMRTEVIDVDDNV